MKPFKRKLALELASLFVVSLIFVAAFMAWRMSRGPMNVDFAKPLVEATFHASTGMHLQIDRLSLGTHGDGTPFVAEAEKINIANADKVPLATIQQVSATISRSGVLTGSIRPISVAIHQPVLFLAAAKPSPVPEKNKSGKSPQDILHRLAEPKSGSTLSRWESASIEDGSVQAPDGTVFISAIDARLERSAVGLKGQLQGRYQSTTQNDVSAAIEINRGQKGSASFHSAPIVLSQLAQLPGLSFLQNYAVPVEATITMNLADTAIDDARVDVSIGQGTVSDAQLPGPVKISGGDLELVYQAKPEHAELRRFTIDLDGPKISTEGHADTQDGKVLIDVTPKIINLPIDSFDKYWPLSASVGGRKWVLNNMSQGKVEVATAHILANAPRDDLSVFDVTKLDGTMSVSGATVHYFGKLPEAKNASAHIDFNKDSMTVNMTGGAADGQVLTSGTVVIDGFSAKDQTIKIDLNLSGPVSGSLDLVDHAPLGYAKKLGLKPADFGGTADTNLHMNFPLLDSVSVDQLNVVTQSDLHDVALPNAVAHKDLTALNGKLYIAQDGMELIGKGALVDVPLTLDYKQSFEKNGATIADFSGTIDTRQRAELGLDFPDRLAGPVGVVGTYNSQGQTGTVDIKLDMTPARFAIDEIGYSKVPGAAGSAKLRVNLQKGILRNIDPIEVEAPQFHADGSAAFDPDSGALTTLTLKSLVSDETNMSVTVSPRDGGGSKIDVRGSEFDARRFLHERHEKDAAATAPDPNPSPMEINVDLAKIKTADGNGLSATKGQLILLGQKWLRADFTSYANGKRVFLSYLPDSDAPAPSYAFHAGAEDAGAALAGFALTNSVKGGVLTVEGKKDAPTDDQPAPTVIGTLELSGFSVSNAPVVARLLNLLSVSGFGKAVSSSDIHFDSFKSKFQVNNTQLRIADGRLRGAALGLTLAGIIDRDAGKIDLYGTAVPAYGANRILNSIPLIGPLLTGGEGQGVFAATYSITGPYDKPDVSLNPLSVFAPGVLRDFLFTPSDPDIDKQ